MAVVLVPVFVEIIGDDVSILHCWTTMPFLRDKEDVFLLRRTREKKKKSKRKKKKSSLEQQNWDTVTLYYMYILLTRLRARSR